MLLLNPPLIKPSEPPAGLALLAGTITEHGYSCHVVDLNLEAIYYLLLEAPDQTDTWGRRCVKNRLSNLKSITQRSTYQNISRYQKVVLELNRLLEISGPQGITLNFGNYQDAHLSPVKSEDLLLMAEYPEKSLFYPFYKRILPEILKNTNHDYIGISINYLSQALNSFSLIGYIREIVPQSKIIVGGGLITSWMSSTEWKSPFNGLIDICVKGCGIKPLLSLFNTPMQKRGKPLFSPTDKPYLAPGFILPYSSSKGCYWNKCNFCPEKAEQNPFLPVTPKDVHDEITSLVKQTDPAMIHFLDNAIPPMILKSFTSTFPARPWYGFVRISQELLDLNFCMQLKQSGCVMLKIGVESGSQTVLEQMNKGVTVKMMSTVLTNLKKVGISTYVYLLFGTPSESLADARQTLEFTLDNSQSISFLNLAIFNMPVNSSNEDKVVTSEFYAGDLSLYTDFIHPLGWNRGKVRNFLDKEFKRSPAIANKLRNDPPHFTSNHAPFLV